MSKRRRAKGNNGRPSLDMESVIQAVAQAQIATQHIPALVAQEIRKSWKQIPNVDPARSPKSWFHDPLSLQYSLGYKDRRFSLTYDTLKRIAGQLSIISAIINTRAAQVSSFAQPYRWTKSLGYTIKHKDPDHKTTPAEMEFIKELEYFVLRCGRSERNPYARVERDDFENFLRKLVRDTLQYDQCCFEIVPDQLGIPFELWAVDAATIRIAADDRYVGVNTSYHSRDGFVPSMPSRFANLYDGRKYGEANAGGRPIGYVQVIQGQIENVYSPEELAFGVRNPRTDIFIQGYGYGELEQLITIITSHLNAEQYNSKFFTQGSSPKGILNLKGDNYTQEMLEGFRRQWIAQVTGVENAWRTPILQSEGIEWIDLNKSNSEMEFGKWMEYLLKITCHTASSKVLTDAGERAISEIQPGDRVYTHTGKLQRVTNTQVSSHNGELLKIHVGGGVTEVTPEHPYLVAKSQQDPVTRRKSLVGKPEWIKAGAIQPGDLLLVPKNTYVNVGTCIEIDLSKYMPNAKVSSDGTLVAPEAHRVSWIRRVLPLNEPIAFALGLYVAEGNSTEKAVYFTLNAKEPALVDAVRALADALHMYVRVYKAKDSTNNVCLHSRVLADAFASLFGERGTKKHVPQEILNAPREIQQAFISGVIAGDGSVPAFKTGAVSVTVSSVSERLISDLRTLLLMQGVYSQEYTYATSVSGFRSDRPQHRLDVNGTQAAKVASWLYGRKGDLLRARTDAAKQLKSHVLEDEEYFYVPVRSIDRVTFIGDVYNLEVEGEHTYQVRRFATHNCAVYLIDPAEINFEVHGGQQQTPLFEASQEWKLKASRDRGLKPLLRFFAKFINRHVIERIDDHFTFEFVGLDEMSENEKHEMLVEQISSYMTLNEARRTLDLSDLPYGDIPMNPVYLQAMTTQQQAQAGGPQGPGGPPNPDEDEDNGEPKYADNFGFDNNEGDDAKPGAA